MQSIRNYHTLIFPLTQSEMSAISMVVWDFWNHCYLADFRAFPSVSFSPQAWQVIGILTGARYIPSTTQKKSFTNLIRQTITCKKYHYDSFCNTISTFTMAYMILNIEFNLMLTESSVLSNFKHLHILRCGLKGSIYFLIMTKKSFSKKNVIIIIYNILSSGTILRLALTGTNILYSLEYIWPNIFLVLLYWVSFFWGVTERSDFLAAQSFRSLRKFTTTLLNWKKYI